MTINTTYFCGNTELDLIIRNNINGDFSIVNNLSEIKPGAFINIDWDEKKLMLPLSLRRDFLSFSDRKWEWRYKFNKDGTLNIKDPKLYELRNNGELKEYLCNTKNA